MDYKLQSQCVPVSELEILSQQIDVDVSREGEYRLRAGRQVHYLYIDGGIFDPESMCKPHLLLPLLPTLPRSNWTTMHLSRAPNGTLTHEFGNEPLPKVEIPCHDKRIDVLDLPLKKRLGPNVSEVLYHGKPAVMKIANFPWEIFRAVNETQAYHNLRQHLANGKQPSLAPEVLGHVTENGRIIGLLLEKLEGDSATIDDLPACADAVRRLHSMGMIHGDVNKYNFIVNRRNNHVKLIDYEHWEPFDEETAEVELDVLPDLLKETTGRGGPPIRTVQE